MTKIKLTSVLAVLLAMLAATPTRAAVMREAVPFDCAQDEESAFSSCGFPGDGAAIFVPNFDSTLGTLNDVSVQAWGRVFLSVLWEGGDPHARASASADLSVFGSS